MPVLGTTSDFTTEFCQIQDNSVDVVTFIVLPLTTGPLVDGTFLFNDALNTFYLHYMASDIW